MSEWKLYRRNFHKYVKEYAWVDPDGVIRYNRVVAPLGWINQSCRLTGMTFKNYQKVTSLKFHKVSTEMTQEQLSKGWLV